MRLPTVLLDVFVTTLFLYILLTVLALGSFSESPEETLPPVDLAKSAMPSAGVTTIEPVTLTVNNGSDGIIYRIGTDAITLPELRTRLKERPPQAAVVRIAATVRFGDAMPLLGLLSEAGITNVTLAYRVSSSQRD